MLQKAANIIKEAQINANEHEQEFISKDTIWKALVEAGIQFQEVDYDGGFYTKKFLLMKDLLWTEDTAELIARNLDLADRDAVTRRYQYLKTHKILKIKDIIMMRMLCDTRMDMFSSHGIMHSVYVVKTSSDWEIDNLNREGVTRQLETIATGSPNADSYLKATILYNNMVKELEERLVKTEQKRTLVDYYQEKPGSAKPSTEEQLIIQSQVEAAYEAMPGNGLTNRTWGFEVEVADAKGVDAVFGIEKGEDGSLRSYESSDDCDCDCDDCVYHDCDCDHCDSQNTDPEHCNNSSCSSADMAEFRSVRGINRVKHAGLFKLCSSLQEEEAEINDTCGVHIHVYSADLESVQVAQLLASYKWLENIMAIVAGRDDVQYAKRLDARDIQHCLKKGQFNASKQQAVNVGPMVNSTRGTIEFRQMAGTIDAKEITIWAWLVRGMVTVAKRGATFQSYKEVTDFNGIIEVFAKFNYFLHDEGTELLIPGASRDAEFIKTNTLRAR